MSYQVFPHQQSAFAALKDTASAFFSGDWQTLPIKPRFCRLITGKSGSGKTHLLRVLAQELGVELYAIGATNWLPMGASERSSRPTWQDITSFIHRHDQGIIFADELDKLSDPTPWMTYLRVEIFSLLDKQIPINLRLNLDSDWDDEPEDEARQIAAIHKKLREKYLVFGGGAFQMLWSGTGKTIGFGGGAAQVPDSLHHTRIASVIPPELANRFAAPIVSIPAMVKSDYLAMLECVYKQLPEPIASAIKDRARRSLEYAVTHDLGCRWIEQLLLEYWIGAQRNKGERKHDLKSIPQSTQPTV